MAAWLPRFGLHLAAAIGATGVFVAAAAVGATETRQQAAAVATPPTETVVRTRTPGARPKPEVVAAAPTPAATDPAAPATPRPRVAAFRPERSLAGTITDVQPDA